MGIKFRKHFDYDVEAASDEATIKDYGPSLTIQSQTEDSDINVMMARFGITHKMPDNPRLPSYGDFTGVNDFQSALNAIQEANDGFMELPADIRSKFENNPQKLIEFLDQPSNIDDAVKLGLLKPEAVDGRKAFLEKQRVARRDELVAAAKEAGLVVAPVGASEPPGAAKAPGSA